MSPPFEFSPVKLVYGGEALGYHAGRTVLAPGLLPSERAEVEEVRTRKGVVQARVLRILDPSPERIEPACPYFGRCGGCQYQHMPYEAQLRAKTEILRETLRRLGKVQWGGPIPAHCGPAWSYRNQAQLKVGKGPNGNATLGFFAAESRRLVPIDACPILSPRLNSLLGIMRSESWSRALANCREVELLADDHDEKVMLTLRGAWSDDVAPSGRGGLRLPIECIGTRSAPLPRANAGPARGTGAMIETEALAQKCREGLPGVVTVALEQGSGLRVFGEPHFTYRVGEFAYRVSPGAFFQSARFLLSEFVASVVAPVPHAGSAPAGSVCGTGATSAGGEAGKVAMDLYAGVGLFTLPLAQCFEQVIAVESNGQAAADLAANARASGKKIRVVAETAFDFLRRCAQAEPSLVVMDPPRAGVGVATLKLLLALRPKRLRYVSCSPPTLARDLGFLLQHGYSLDALEMFDFFPQTYHIESLARLSRTAR